MAVHGPDKQQAWFDRTVRPWLAATPATHKLPTWSNPDWCEQMCSFCSDTPAHAIDRSPDPTCHLRQYNDRSLVRPRCRLFREHGSASSPVDA